MRCRAALLASAIVAVTVVLGVFASPASAHPLGNFTVNHLDELSLATDGVVVDAVVDLAEIPTTQARSEVDRDGNGDADGAELDAYASSRCADVALAQQLTVDGTRVDLGVQSAQFAYGSGQAGLPTSRLECLLKADVQLSEDSVVAFVDDFDADRVGWREIVAAGDGMELSDSTASETSITDGLREYPGELLESPPQMREVSMTVGAVSGPRSAPVGDPSRMADDLGLTSRGPASGVLGRVQGMFDDLIGRRDITVPVGLLAVGLAMLLGTTHALLPGHGKTIMAAYIAGREGSMRDAVLVGATVTGTHTSGVLLLGLALTLSTALAGEVVIGWLGIVSGLFVAGLGVALVVGHRRRGGRSRWSLETHHHSPYGAGADHSHDHGHHHHDADADGHDHGHDGHSHRPGGGADHEHDVPVGGDHTYAQLVHPDGLDDVLDEEDLLHLQDDLVHVHDELVSHGHDHRAPVRDASGLGLIGTPVLALAGGASTLSAPVASVPIAGPVAAGAADGGNPRIDAASTTTVVPERAFSRLGLVGMGVAGGLVPSPSALVILLSAIALGRTAFGVLLVLAYGLGMAITLTAAGVLLVYVRDRWVNRVTTGVSRIGDRWRRIMPYATAALIIVVGAGLALRSLWSL